MGDLQPVIKRLKEAQERDDRQEHDCLAELRAMGLLEAGFGDRTRRQWIDEVRAILHKHQIGGPSMGRKKGGLRDRLQALEHKMCKEHGYEPAGVTEVLPARVASTHELNCFIRWIDDRPDVQAVMRELGITWADKE